MLVRDLMQTNVRSVSGAQTVGEVIATLAEGHISGLPVVDPHGKLEGVITATDVLDALAECEDAAARDRLLEDTLVQEIMTPRPQTITPDATAKEAAQRLLYLEVHRLFVEEDGKLVGVISTSDLVRALAAERV